MWWCNACLSSGQLGGLRLEEREFCHLLQAEVGQFVSTVFSFPL